MRTCQKILVVAAAAMLAARAWGGTGATQAWVANYVSNYVGSVVTPAVAVSNSTDGTWYAMDGNRLFVEKQTEFCLAVMEQTELSASLGYTNDCIFAKVPGESLYRHGPLTIVDTPTNFYTTAGGVTYESVKIGKAYWLALVGGGQTNLFCHLCGTYLGPSQVEAILAIGGGDE